MPRALLEKFPRAVEKIQAICLDVENTFRQRLTEVFLNPCRTRTRAGPTAEQQQQPPPASSSTAAAGQQQQQQGETRGDAQSRMVSALKLAYVIASLCFTASHAGYSCAFRCDA